MIKSDLQRVFPHDHSVNWQVFQFFNGICDENLQFEFKMTSEAPNPIQLLHSDLELLFFIKKHLFINIFVKFTSEHVKLLKFSTQPVLNLKTNNFVGEPFVVMYY